jgi:hypothetical protein
MNSDDVIGKLKAVSQAGQPVKLVVARAVDTPEPGIVPEINDVRVCNIYTACQHSWSIQMQRMHLHFVPESIFLT